MAGSKYGRRARVAGIVAGSIAAAAAAAALARGLMAANEIPALSNVPYEVPITTLPPRQYYPTSREKGRRMKHVRKPTSRGGPGGKVLKAKVRKTLF